MLSIGVVASAGTADNGTKSSLALLGIVFVVTVGTDDNSLWLCLCLSIMVVVTLRASGGVSVSGGLSVPSRTCFVIPSVNVVDSVGMTENGW